MTTPLKLALEAASVSLYGAETPRWHLGASSIGKECVRALWYSFRKAYTVKHTGRLLRLFNRGKREEAAMNDILRAAGIEVSEFADLETKKQWSFQDVDGHFAGSCDALVRGDLLPSGWGILEQKTHNTKSFTTLKTKSVMAAKYEHYVQMQIYMHYMEKTWALYLAVNKDTDEYYVEVVFYIKDVAEFYIDRAKSVIAANIPPPRCTDNSAWLVCKFCDFREICWHDKVPDRHCLTCTNSCPVDDAGWYCSSFEGRIPKDFLLTGCDNWRPHG